MLKASSDRIQSRLARMAEIGRDPAGGISRLALTDEDKQGRDLLVEWMEQLALDVRIDDVGNIYGRREGLRAGAPAVMVGSHLDTVPNGGVFDGAMGVVAGLEIVSVLNDAHRKTRYPIEIVSFSNEEGARFEPSIVGSGVIAGMFSYDYIANREARDDGARFIDELERIGYLGRRGNRPGPLKAFLEYHVEQGPRLEAEQLRCGIVEGVVGFAWLNVEVTGQTDHAGPTPMHMRRDALVAAARITTSLRDIASWVDPELVATVGRLRVRPDVINAIPGHVVLSLDVRHANDETIESALTSIRRMIQQVAEQEGVEARIEEIKIAPAVRFDAVIIDALEQAAHELALPSRRMVSGAGHDAEYMASLAPSAMIFAPSHGGKSHSPDEWTDRGDVVAGSDVLLRAVLKLIEVEEREDSRSG